MKPHNRNHSCQRSEREGRCQARGRFAARLNWQQNESERIRKASKDHFLRIIEDLRGRGAQGVILGCTEPGLLISTEDVDPPLFDTAIIHAEEAALESAQAIMPERTTERS